MQHALGQPPPGWLIAFAGGLQASWRSENATRSFHPNGNGEMERVNHTMAQMLEWWSTSSILTRVRSLPTSNSGETIHSMLPSVSFPTRSTWAGLRASLSRFLNPPASSGTIALPVIISTTAIWRPTVRSADDIVREHHALTVSRVERRNGALSDALHAVPKYAVGG